MINAANEENTRAITTPNFQSGKDIPMTIIEQIRLTKPNRICRFFKYSFIVHVWK